MIKKIERYFLSNYELVDSRFYYLKLSIILGLILTIFVFLFDPFDNISTPLRYDVSMNLIRLGYGLNLTIVIYIAYWVIYRKMWFCNKNRPWKTYHHWLLIFLIYFVASISGTVYHRLFLDVGKVDLNQYFFVTLPRSILIGALLITIAILLDKLYEQNKRIESLQKLKIDGYGVIPKNKISPKNYTRLKSPIIKQSVMIEPQNITYLKAFGNYVEIHLKDEKRAKLLRSPLHNVADQLSSFSFIKKCHRQYYINISEVECYLRNSNKVSLQIKNSLDKVPVSRNHTKEILSIIERF